MVQMLFCNKYQVTITSTIWVIVTCLQLISPAQTLGMGSIELQNLPIETIESSPIPVKGKIFKYLKADLREDNQRKIKITAAALAVALGPFGMHRLYLGTSPLVPAIYVATVGGGVGILPFIDFVVIVFSKDITPYMNNKQIFMWANN